MSDGVFYTDSNARETLKRKKNHRPTWDLKLEEPIAGNYYPVTSKIYLKDEIRALKLCVLTDRAQGGTSLRDGELELMVSRHSSFSSDYTFRSVLFYTNDRPRQIHRRLLKDDAFGVGEALNETAYGEGLIVRGQHYLYGSDSSDLDGSASREKKSTLELALRPWTLISPASGISFEQWSKKYNMQGNGLRKELPPNVQILTLEPWKDDTILLRLEHIFEITEASHLSRPVEVNIQVRRGAVVILSTIRSIVDRRVQRFFFFLIIHCCRICLFHLRLRPYARQAWEVTSGSKISRDSSGKSKRTIFAVIRWIVSPATRSTSMTTL